MIRLIIRRKIRLFKMNNNFNIVFFISGIIIGIILFHYGCGKNNNNQIINSSDTTYFTTIDTIFYEHIDTIIFIDSNSIHSTIPTSIDTNFNNNIFTTIEIFKDSTNTGYLEGKLKINTFGYTLKDWKLDWKYNTSIIDTNKSMIITIKDSIIINNTIIENKRKLYAGFELDIKPINHVYLGIDYLDKKGNMFGIAIGTDLQDKEIIYKMEYKRLINFK